MVISFFNFHPYLGEDSHFDYIIFFKWIESNHELVSYDISSAFFTGRSPIPQKTIVTNSAAVIFLKQAIHQIVSGRDRER